MKYLDTKSLWKSHPKCLSEKTKGNETIRINFRPVFNHDTSKSWRTFMSVIWFCFISYLTWKDQCNCTQSTKWMGKVRNGKDRFQKLCIRIHFWPNKVHKEYVKVKHIEKFWDDFDFSKISFLISRTKFGKLSPQFKSKQIFCWTNSHNYFGLFKKFSIHNISEGAPSFTSFSPPKRKVKIQFEIFQLKVSTYLLSIHRIIISSLHTSHEPIKICKTAQKETPSWIIK